MRQKVTVLITGNKDVVCCVFLLSCVLIALPCACARLTWYILNWLPKMKITLPHVMAPGTYIFMIHNTLEVFTIMRYINLHFAYLTTYSISIKTFSVPSR